MPDVVCDSQEPIATQASVAEHETLDRSLKMAAGPFGLATVDHVVPFHLRTSVFVPELPTAKQVVVVGHARFSMLPPPPTLLFDAVHAVPSHCPISSPCDDHPIAMHRVLVGHETSEMPASVAPGGFGNETIDQCAPSQCSTSATSEPAKIESPTAKQLLTLAHNTRVSWLLVTPAGFGLERTDQAVPFQRPISVVPRWWIAFPTPKQTVVLGQSTLRNSLCELEMGDGTIDQLVPLDRSRSRERIEIADHLERTDRETRTRGRARHRRETAARRARRNADVRARDVRPRGAVEPLDPREGARRVAAVLPDRDTLAGARARNALERSAVAVLRQGGAAVAITDQLVPFQRSEKGRGPLGE